MPVKLVPILPTLVFDPSIIDTEIKKAMDSILKGVGKEYALTTNTFTSKVEFLGVSKLKTKEGIVSNITKSKVYLWLNNGTKKRTIKAKPGKFLVFNVGFVPKTVPGRIRAKNSRKFGKLIFTKLVRNHQIKARKFDKRINPKWSLKLGIALQKAMSLGAKKTGYAI